jgi:hypothetical protein
MPKHRLKEYLAIQGVQYDERKKTYRCPNPLHNDESPSAVLYRKGKHVDYPVLWCPVCNEAWSVVDVAMMLHGFKEYGETMEHLKSVLNITEITDNSSTKREEKKPEPEIIPVSHEERRKYYNGDYIKKIASEKGWGDVVSVWEYTDKNDMVTALDVRFENEGKKTVITWTYNGKLKHYGVEPQIYNLYECLNTDKPILITEGCKCAEISRQLEGFTPCSWSGGAHKAGLVDWTIFKDKQIYILPDNDEPGFKAAEEIKKQLPHAIIVRPLTEGKGDDIEQAIEQFDLEEIKNKILKSCEITPPSDSTQNKIPPIINTTHRLEGGGFSEPFRILGMCEGEGHFIDNWGYYQHYKLDSIGKGRLMNIAPLEYWKAVFPAGRDGVKWDEAISDIITSCKTKEFDTKKLKGRGAWRSGDKICYNDGCKLWGEPDENNIYMKLERREVGLDREPLEPEKVARIRDILFDLSFESKTDAVRTMGWSAIAPFSGALTYRPTLLLTGESGHGKTKVQTMFIKPLTKCNHYDMGTTSSAGVRRQIGKDSAVGFFDESGKDTGNKQINISEILAFIRSNYSDDSPDSVKANINSDGYVSYKMSSMFGLATTDPTIENVQDENRILRVHFVKPKHSNEEWNAIEKELGELLSEENCHRIRALTWSRLHIIMNLAKKITQLARNRTNRDIRSSHADMLLASAYMVVWCNTPEPTEEQINDMLDKYYQYQPMEENRSESEEYVDRIMQEIIEVIHENAREKITIQECLQRSYDRHYKNDDGQVEEVSPKKASEYNRYLAMYGIKLIHPACVHIANNHHMIQKITGLGAGYGKLFTRHKGAVKYDKPVTYFGKSHRGTLITGLIVKQEKDKTEVEKLMEVI